MATFGEYTSKKKKKVSFGEYTRSVLGDDVEINEIGPVKETKKKEEKRTWFKSGEFEDGYQFGDLTKTILGSAGDLLEDAGTGILGMGEKAVDSLMYIAPLVTKGQYYQNGGGYNIQRDKVFEDTISQSKKTNEEFIKKDLYNEENIAKSIISNPIKKATGFDIEGASVFGAKSDSLAQSAGQLLGTVGLQAVGVPWWLTTGATSFGSEAENALKQDATYEEAGLSSLITAGGEILTEKLSGGIKFGGKTLDDVTIKPLTNKISNKVVKTLVNLGVDATGEGLEEVASSVISNLGTALYKEESIGELLASEEALDEYIESFIGGAVLGGGSSAIGTIRESRGNNEVSFTENEQKVFDKVYQDAIAEQEADGKKLSQREKSELYDKTLNALEKGYIDTDTIESVVGGDAYSSLKAITEQETASKKEYDALYQMKNGEKSDAQVDRQAELKKHLEEIATRKAKLREELDGVVSGLVQGNKLSEAYNEKGRKRQVFEADLTKYDSKQAEVVKKAAESGILNNTNKTHDFVDMIAKISAEKGVSFDFTNNQKLKESGFALDGKTVNGFVKDGSISLNIDSAKALNTVVGHEITHVLKGNPELYGEFQSLIFELAKTKGEYDTRFQDITKLYEGVNGADIADELTADLVGDYLFTDSDFISRLSVEKPNVFKRIFDEIKYLYKVATAGSKELRELEKVKRTFEKVYRESGKTTTDTKYSVSDNNIKEISTGYAYGETYFTMSYTQDGKEAGTLKYGDFDGEPNVKMIEVLPEYRRKGIGTKLLQELQKKYPDAEINFGMSTPDGTKLLESITYKVTDETVVADRQKLKDMQTELNELQERLDILYDTENLSEEQNAELERLGDRWTEVYDTIRELEQTLRGKKAAKTFVKTDSDIQYSLSDSEGHQLSKEQQEYFKDSKVRDDNGNLKVMYHGTEKGGFHEFVSRFSDDGKSFFFVDNPEVAKGYSGTHEEYAPVSFKTAEDLNRFFKEINATDYSAAEDNGKFILYDEGDEVATSDTADGLHEEFRDWTGLGYGSANYKVYVNVVNPLVVDAKGENWDSLDMADYDYDQETVDVHDFYVEQTGWDLEKNKPIFHVEAETSENTYDEDMSEEDIYNHFGRSFAENLVEKAKDDFEGYQIWKTRRINKDVSKNLPVKTRDFAEYAFERGYDGVIFKNIVDNGLYASGKERFMPATVVVAFDSSQIKSVKNAEPTNDPDIRYSLSDGNQGRRIAPGGNFNVYGKDIALQQDIAPVREDVQTQPVITKEPVQDDIAPLTEDQANDRDTDQIEQSYFIDEDGIPERDEPYYNADMAPDSPFDKRDYETIGNRKIKAYMYENPEVKPFFQEEAMGMLAELNNSVKGERGYNDDLYYDTNGEMGFYGVKRHTSEDIAYLLDKKLDSYADIERGLKAIIEDHGAENNATSKRIEFILDERLRSGYRDFFTGERIPPNQDYINLLTEKQITEYNDEAWDNFVRNSSEEDIQEYFGENEDIGPVAPAVQPEKAVMEDIGPVRDDIQQTWDDVDSTADEMPLYEQENGRLSMFEEPEAPKKVTRSVLHSNIVENIKNRFAEKGFDFDNVLRKAKDLSTLSTVDNTPQRVMEKALGYKQGQILGDLTVNQVAQNETEGTKWLDSFTNRKSGLLAQISKQYHIKPGSKESSAAQMYAEGFYVDENENIIAYGDTELAKDFPDRRVQENIKGLAKDERIRKIYDETLKMINESRARNAYPEIPRLDNYFLHFRAMDDTFSRLGLPFNPNDIRAKDLPTDLNGVTADLKPGQPYFASAMHRTGKRTSFDLLGGLERYLSSAKNQIYHIDDIQTLRALRNYIADTYGQAHGLESLDTLSEEEAQERIKDVYGSHLSTFAKFLNEEANVLAGKTALIDRGLEGIIGRRGITFLDTLNRQVGANMVGFNISSSLTNFLSVAQTFAKSNKADFVKAFAQTTSNKISSIFGRNDGFAEQSPVMIRRKGADRFYRTPWQKAGDTGYALMGAVDSISAELIARTKYNELTRKGMDSQKAHYETDKWVSRLMGDRSLGQQPQLYNSKMLGVLTKFQLEVRNQLDSQFYDTIQEAKVSSEDIKNGLARNAKTAAKVTSTFVQLAVAQHLFGKAFESVAGYNPAFDIIGVLIKAFGFDDDEEKEDTVLDNVEQAFLELLGDLPYTSTLTGGRIPIASALPVEQFITGKDDYGNEKSRWETIKETAPYYLLPGGYSQLKKTTQGLGMFDDDLPIAGSYTDSGNLRFPVEDTLQNRVQAGVFGQWASDEARDYFDNERKPLKEKQIQELIDVDLPISEYWKYRDGLSGLDSLSDKADYINSLDLPIDKKNILVNNQADRKEPIDLTGFDDRFADFEEFDFAVNNPEKYEIAKKVGGYAAYKSYKDGMKDMKLEEKVDYVAGLDLTTEQKNALINGETERKEPIDLTGYDEYGDLEELDYATKNPGKYTISKVVGGYEKFSVYADEIGDIRADKDSNGKTINGSAKEKKTAYINGLDLDYGQKILLYRTYFDSQADKEAYNYDIVEYLNGREDVSYEEMVKILEELDMKVLSDGTVTW